MPCPPPLLLMRADGLEPDMGEKALTTATLLAHVLWAIRCARTKEAMRRGSRAVDMAANEY